MKKILFIHHSTDWGGSPINIFNIIQKLDTDKYEPVFFLLKECELVKYLKAYGISYRIAESKYYHRYYHKFAHLETSTIPWYKYHQYVIVSISWLLSRYIFAPRELKKFHYDIYHLNSSVLSDWLKPCHDYGKTVFHIQETILNKPKGIRFNFLRSQIKRYADKVVAISNHSANKIELFEKTSVIYNFANLAKSEPIESSYASKQVLYVGGQSEIKGFHLLVDSLQYIDSDIKILCAGNYRENTSKEWFKMISNRYKKKWIYLNTFRKSKNVVEIGLVSDIKPYLDECVCLISPFTSPHFSRPVIEAYANYKSVVVTELDGMEEIVKKSKDPTGIICEKNPRQLAAAINKICGSPQLAKSMGANGYGFAKSYFSSKNVLRLEKIYDEL